jgi:hypothetical protein
VTHLLILALIVALYAAKQVRNEREALQLELLAVRAGHLPPRSEWQQAEDRLAAERRVWQHTTAIHEAARQAMHDAVTRSPVTTPPRTRAPRIVVPPSRGAPPPRPRVSRPGVPADDEWFARRVP